MATFTKDLGHISEKDSAGMHDKAKLTGGMIYNQVWAIDKTKGASYARA